MPPKQTGMTKEGVNMKKFGYKNTKGSRNGDSSITIYAGISKILRYYCKKKNINMTHYINSAVEKQLLNDMKNEVCEVPMNVLYELEKNSSSEKSEVCT